MTTPHFFAGPSRTVITSSRALEVSFESGQPTDGGPRSAFTGAIVEGLRTGAADVDGDGLISTEDLYTYIRDSLRRQGIPQTPQKSSSGSGTAVVAKAARGVATSHVRPETVAVVREPSVRRPATWYSPDDLEAVDELEFAPAADALAELVASKRLAPPLAIGLFGEWGAGKSFFMRLVKQRIQARCDASGPGPQDGEPNVSHVVHVEFNAWHYVEANIWASLATRIFQSIAEYLEESTGSPGDAHRVLLGQLESSQQLLDEAEQRQSAAEQALGEAEQRISSVRAAQEQRSVAQLHVDHPEAAPAVNALSSDLGIDPTATVTSVRDRIRELREASNIFSRLWTLLTVQVGTRARLKVLAVPILLLLVGMSTATGLYLAGREVAPLLPWISALAAGGSALLAAAQKAARIVRSGAELIGIDTLDEETALASAREASEKARRTLREVERQLEDLQTLDATGVYRFVSERYASPEYAKYMGAASLIEQDLQALSRLLTATATDAGQPVERGGRRMRVDRIVLYIDDLDRCPAGTVREVLQAIHLLLSLRLFVVMVGVDSHWLHGALRSEYDEITADLPSYRGTMPFRYLEKIFHIPFWVPSMDDAGYRRLMRSLIDPVDARERQVAQAAAAGAASAGQAQPPGWIVTPEEAAFLGELGGLVQTPRRAKRLANIYRLLKASGSAADRKALEPPGNEFRVALTLAAIATGFPENTVTIFDQLGSSTAPTWSRFLAEVEPLLPPQAMAALLHASGSRLGGVELAPFRAWAPRVVRFSFAGLGRVG